MEVKAADSSSSEEDAAAGAPLVEIMVSSHLGDDGRPCGRNHLSKRNLDPELLYHVLGFLDGRSLIQLGMTSKALGRRVDVRRVWKGVLNRDYAGVGVQPGGANLTVGQAMRLRFVAIKRRDADAVAAVYRAAGVRRHQLQMRRDRLLRSHWKYLIAGVLSPLIVSVLMLVFLCIVTVRLLDGERLQLVDTIPFICVIVFLLLAYAVSILAEMERDQPRCFEHRLGYVAFEMPCDFFLDIQLEIMSAGASIYFCTLVVVQVGLLVARWSTAITWSYWVVWIPTWTYLGSMCLFPCAHSCFPCLRRDRGGVAGPVASFFMLIGVHVALMATAIALQTEKERRDSGTKFTLVIIPTILALAVFACAWLKDITCGGQYKWHEWVFSAVFCLFLGGSCTTIGLLDSGSDVSLGFALIPFVVIWVISIGAGLYVCHRHAKPPWVRIRESKAKCCRFS